jgi:conjugative transposon TraN protein
MKKHLIFLSIFSSISFTSIHAQNDDSIPSHLIAASPLELAYSKTTHLIFPYSIVTVDRGSNTILAQKAKGVNNILQLKASVKEFEQTNLTVITADGKIYSFAVGYNDSPKDLTVQYGNAIARTTSTTNTSSGLNESQINQDAMKISRHKKTVFGVKRKKDGIVMKLDGLYVDQDVMYLQLRLNNRTQIDYDIERFDLSVDDSRQSKRTASQEVKIEPLLIYRKETSISANANELWVVAIPKMTIPDKKQFIVKLGEKNGGRNLRMHIKNKSMVRATSIL